MARRPRLLASFHMRTALAMLFIQCVILLNVWIMLEALQ